MENNKEIILSIELSEVKRIVYLLNNHQKLLSMLKMPEVLKGTLDNDIISIRRILDKFKEVKKENKNE
jgi:hypothetical protein